MKWLLNKLYSLFGKKECNNYIEPINDVKYCKPSYHKKSKSEMDRILDSGYFD